MLGAFLAGCAPGSAASPVEDPPPATATPLPAPAEPTGVTFEEKVVRLGEDASDTELAQTVTWEAPRSHDVDIWVFGVTRCLAEPPDSGAYAIGACLTEDTPVHPPMLTPLARAPAANGFVTWTWTGTFDCGVVGLSYDPEGPMYFAIVLAAYNAAGHSTYAIADTGQWVHYGPDETVC